MNCELLPEAVFGVDTDCLVREVNAAGVALARRDRSELIGTAMTDLIRRSGTETSWEGDWKRAASRLYSVRGMPDQEVWMCRPDGSTLAAVMRASFERDQAGSLVGAWFTVREARRRGRRFTSGAEVVSAVGHELRSPLTSVKGYTSLLLNRWERLSDDQKMMMLDQIHHDADRVTRLITELLDISRLEARRLVLRPSRVDLHALASEAISQAKEEFPELEAEISLAGANVVVAADVDRIRFVLVNMLENACKYGSEKGIVVAVGSEGHEMVVSVADRGNTLGPKDQDKVFNKFHRGPLAKPTGSGLGLWISKGLVEAHGGRMWARADGKGATFWFSIPIDEDEPFDGGTHPGAQAEEEGS